MGVQVRWMLMMIKCDLYDYIVWILSVGVPES
jgi:hypothetical protein